MRVLIAGGTGFIGSNLARRMAALGAEVHSVSRGGAPSCLVPGVTYHAADLQDDRLARLFARLMPNYVFLLATRTRPRRGESAARGMLTGLEDAADSVRLVEAVAALARKPDVVVRAGSLAEYGAAPLPMHEDGPAHPVTPYAAGMLAGTHAAGLAARRAGVRFVTARLALIYGQGQDGRFFVPATIRALLGGRASHVATPLARRDLMHVDDAVDGLLRIASRAPDDLPVVNLATGRAERMGDVAAMIARAARRDGSAVIRHSDPASDILLGCTERAKERLGWTARVPLEDGIARTVLEEAGAVGGRRELEDVT